MPELAMPELGPPAFTKMVDSSGGSFGVDPGTAPALSGTQIRLPAGALNSPVRI